MTEAIEGDLPPGEGPPANATTTSTTSTTTASKVNKSTRNAVEWVAIVIGALAVALIVKTFLIQAFFIPSLSMYSTLDKGDRVLVNKLSYHLHDIHRGDIVVFERPPKVADSDIKDLIKRVVGLPGDTVQGRDGKVYVNGKPLDEGYLDEGVTTSEFPVQTIADGQIWVMGDNRTNSEDSRFFGPIDADLVVGRAFVRVWPIPDIHLF